MSRKSLIVVSDVVGCTAGVAFLFGNIDGAIVGYLCVIWLLLLSDRE